MPDLLAGDCHAAKRAGLEEPTQGGLEGKP